MFQITIDYNRAHIMHSEPIRTVALQDEANEFARHLASNMIYALTTDSFYDGFSDADPFTATLTDYEKSVLYSVFLAKPDDFWFHVINDQTGELVNAADDEYHNEPIDPCPDELCQIETDTKPVAEIICDYPSRPELANQFASFLYGNWIDFTHTEGDTRVTARPRDENEKEAVVNWLNDHRENPKRKFELYFNNRDKQDALIERLDAYDIEHTENSHRVTMFFNNDREIAHVMDYLNRD